MNLVSLAVAAAMMPASATVAPVAPALKAVRTIPLPNVMGRIDHLAADVNGRRLFVCALGNDSVEIVDLKASKRARAIKGLGAPQGVAYVPESDRLVVANDKGGKVERLRGKGI